MCMPLQMASAESILFICACSVCVYSSLHHPQQHYIRPCTLLINWPMSPGYAVCTLSSMASFCTRALWPRLLYSVCVNVCWPMRCSHEQPLCVYLAMACSSMTLLCFRPHFISGSVWLAFDACDWIVMQYWLVPVLHSSDASDSQSPAWRQVEASDLDHTLNTIRRLSLPQHQPASQTNSTGQPSNHKQDAVPLPTRLHGGLLQASTPTHHVKGASCKPQKVICAYTQAVGHMCMHVCKAVPDAQTQPKAPHNSQQV